MQKVMCEHCKAVVPVMLYFYGERINVHTSSLDPCKPCKQYYEAEVYGRSVCPYCGAEVKKRFNKYINKEDIIDLAGGRGE